jgi:hypothetical protein
MLMLLRKEKTPIPLAGYVILPLIAGVWHFTRIATNVMSLACYPVDNGVVPLKKPYPFVRFI